MLAIQDGQVAADRIEPRQPAIFVVDGPDVHHRKASVTTPVESIRHESTFRLGRVKLDSLLSLIFRYVITARHLMQIDHEGCVTLKIPDM